MSVRLPSLTLALLVSVFALDAVAQAPAPAPAPTFPFPIPTIPGLTPPAQPGQPPPPGGYPPPGQQPPPTYPQPGYPPPGYVPPPPGRPVSTGLEMGMLYGTSIAWGAGVGIWIDSEIWHDSPVDPGLALIAPIAFGAAAPATVFLVDRFAFRRGMPEGLPSAVATGMLVGAGEGLGIAGTQWVTSNEANEWGFRGLARAEVITSTIGAGAGVGLYYLLKPVPETNVLISSATVWGAGIGSMIAGGSTTGCKPATVPDCEWGATNDWVAIGGLIGFNVAVAGAVGASIWWTPSWNQLGWMWGGFAIGGVASLPVYAIYAATDNHDPRRGLVFTSAASALGLGLGVALASPRRRNTYASYETEDKEINDDFIQLQGAGFMEVNQGAGVQVNGALW